MSRQGHEAVCQGKETKEKIERLVSARRYKNKSEALRRIVEQHFEEHPELLAADDIPEIIEEAEKMSDDEFDRLAAEVFGGPRSAAELVGEGRER